MIGQIDSQETLDAKDRDPFGREDDIFLESSSDWKTRNMKNRRLFDDQGRPFNINQVKNHLPGNVSKFGNYKNFRKYCSSSHSKYFIRPT